MSDPGPAEPKVPDGLAPPLTRRTALVSSGAVAAAAIVPAAWTAAPVGAQDARRRSQRFAGGAFVSDLVHSITKRPYANRSISAQAAARLGARLSADAVAPSDIAGPLSELCELSARSLEAALAECRKVAASRATSGGADPAVAPENDVRAAVSELNEFCLRRYGLPFPRAALGGRTAPIDSSEAATKLAALGSASGGPRTFAGCFTDVYPRYVGHGWPAGKYYWLKGRPSHHPSLRSRVQDPGCHVDLDYSKYIVKWFGISARAYGVVSLNGWGNGTQVAANTNSLFVKSWTLVPYGITPVALGHSLWVVT